MLVLNQSYEPLGICNARRAIVLYYLGKAEIVVTADGLKVYSVSSSLPLPSVLRLSNMVKVRRREVPLTKPNIMKRDNFTCQYCTVRNVRMTLDHVVPRTMGGNDSWENLVCACEACNSRKGNHTPQQAGLSLIRRPRKPHYFTFVLRSLGVTPEEWRPYLFLS